MMMMRRGRRKINESGFGRTRDDAYKRSNKTEGHEPNMANADIYLDAVVRGGLDRR